MTSTIAWNLVASYYDELPYGGDGLMHASQPWSGWYEVGSVLWVTAHTTQFTQPGWFYLGHGSGVGSLSSGGTFVSLTDGRGNLTIVIETMTDTVGRCVYDGAPIGPISTQEVTLRLTDEFAQLKVLYVFHTSLDPANESYFIEEGPIAPVNQSITLTILPNSLYTISTLRGRKGSHGDPPPRGSLPFPYADNFDSYALSSQAKYLADQAGSFEVVQASDPSRGRVVRQMAPGIPVVWCGQGEAAMAYSLIGDHNGWRGVRAEVDVLIETAGTAGLGVAVSSGGCTGSWGSDGVVLAVSTAGTWTVSNHTSLLQVVAQGKVTVPAQTWLRLGVDFGDAGALFTIDGQQVANLTRLTNRTRWGWVALVSSYNFTQFDRLNVTHNTHMSALHPRNWSRNRSYAGRVEEERSEADGERGTPCA